MGHGASTDRVDRPRRTLGIFGDPSAQLSLSRREEFVAAGRGGGHREARIEDGGWRIEVGEPGELSPGWVNWSGQVEDRGSLISDLAFRISDLIDAVAHSQISDTGTGTIKLCFLAMKSEIPNPKFRFTYSAALRPGTLLSICSMPQAPAVGSIFRGLHSPAGLKACRTSPMTSRSDDVNSLFMKLIFSTPMPCSPVTLPPISMHLFKISSLASSTRLI